MSPAKCESKYLEHLDNKYLCFSMQSSFSKLIAALPLEKSKTRAAKTLPHTKEIKLKTWNTMDACSIGPDTDFLDIFLKCSLTEYNLT